MIKAKFNSKTKEEIYERDNKSCVICWSNTNLQFHHVYYSIQANYWKDRNNTSQWVTICFDCHLLAHGCKSWNWVREQCINYIKNL